jgi:hypothetical protein
MAIYTVLTPQPHDGETDPMAFVFVKEGFSWPALIVPELWLIFRRMWWVLLAYLAVGVFFIVAGPRFGDALPVTFILLARLLFALEGNELRRWTLRRRGYGTVDVVEGRGLEEAEIHFFAAREDAGPDAEPIAPAPPPPPQPAKLGPMPPSVEAGDVVGLFPAPQGGRTA